MPLFRAGDGYKLMSVQQQWRAWEARAEQSRAECEALRLKAARYDWLQEKMRGAVPLVRVLKMHRGAYIHLTSLEQIDAALGKEKA